MAASFTGFLSEYINILTVLQEVLIGCILASYSALPRCMLYLVVDPEGVQGAHAPLLSNSQLQRTT